MTFDKILVFILGFVSIIFVYWFFFLKKEKQVKANQEIDILVDGGYSPDTIVIQKNKTTKLNFFRKDPSDCLEDVIIGDFKIRKNLPLNQTTTIEIKPTKTGEFKFTCGMGMFHGKLIVK